MRARVLSVHFYAVGFPSSPRVVVRFIFLSIVSHWDIKGLLFVDQQGSCRLLAGPGRERFASPPFHLPFLSPIAETELLSMSDLRRKAAESALPQKPCLDFKTLSVVLPHWFGLSLDEACFRVPQTPHSQFAQQVYSAFNINLIYKKQNVPQSLIAAAPKP